MTDGALQKRRGITARHSCRGALRGWHWSTRYVGLPLIEPAFATLQRCDDPNVCVHGRLVQISLEDLQQLVRTEGGGGHEDLGCASPQPQLLPCCA